MFSIDLFFIERKTTNKLDAEKSEEKLTTVHVIFVHDNVNWVHNDSNGTITYVDKNKVQFVSINLYQFFTLPLIKVHVLRNAFSVLTRDFCKQKGLGKRN